MEKQVYELPSTFDEFIDARKAGFMKVKEYKESIDNLIFNARNKHVQKIQYGNLPMEFDYIIFNLFVDLNRATEHCMNACRMIK